MRILSTTALLVLGSAAIAAADDYRVLSGSHPLAAGQSVHIEFHSGDLEIEAGSTDKVEVEIELKCEWRRSDCEEMLDDVEILWRSTDRRLHMEVDGLSTWRRARVDVDATIKLPATAVLSIEMGAGELAVDGVTNDLRVELGAGEARVWMPESAVESVSIDVGVGEAQFRGKNEFVSGRRALLIGSELYWDDGPGKALVEIEVGAGEATVWLD